MTAIYTLTVFTSAFLLFLIQPMISKMLLPGLGGSPAVWNTAMMFFQTLLLAGYLYVHASTKWLGARKQAMLHAVLLMLALMCLPIALKDDFDFASIDHPIRWVTLSLLLSVGFPFFLLAANAPLLQYWLSRTTHKDAANPYFLYSASNVGSLLALFAYPFIIEPLLTLPGQTGFWSLLFVGFILLVWGSAWQMREHYNPKPPSAAKGTGAAPDAKTRMHWLLLAFFPSSLLLGVTTFITTDIASMPLFWVIPLAIYLGTFILAFMPGAPMTDRAFNAQIVLVPLTVMIIALKFNYMSPILLIHLLTFFVMAMGCHGTLARRKPDTRYLTEYYVWISLGGMLGGMFNSLVAPQVFTEPVEYPLILILCLMMRPVLMPDTRREKILDWLLPVSGTALLIGLMLAIQHLPEVYDLPNKFRFVIKLVIYCYLMAAVFLFYKRPLRFTLFILSLLIVLPMSQNVPGKESPGQFLYSERNFFGVNRVFYWKPMEANLLMHGTTTHGLQSREKKYRLQPNSYYGPPLKAIRALPAAVRGKPIAVLGLGTGTLACLGSGGQTVDFYEIDPAVAAIARNSEYFTYLRDCPVKASITMGDGRLMIDQAKDGYYGILVVDVFNSDAIPLHLLTREALAIYLSKVSPDGVMVFNVSNRHLELVPIMGALAQDAGLKAVAIRSKKLDNKLSFASEWVIMSRSEARIREVMRTDSEWKTLKNEPPASIWTDNYSNILETMF